MLLNFTLTSNQGVVNFKLDEPNDTTIQDIKKKIVGDSIESIGYDKIKLFQSGHHLEDSSTIGELNQNPILVFPTVNSVRPLIVSRFSKKMHDEEKVPDKVIEEKVKLVSIKEEDLDKKNLEVLEKFKTPIFKNLLQIYLTKNDEFMDFLKYLTGGNVNNFSVLNYQPKDELISDIKNTFSSFKDVPNETIKGQLIKMHGNLNLLLTHQLSTS